jgi:hypothetical protein
MAQALAAEQHDITDTSHVSNPYIDIGFAESARIARDAGAREGCESVSTRAAVATGNGRALVDKRLTEIAAVSIVAVARETVIAVHTRQCAGGTTRIRSAFLSTDIKTRRRRGKSQVSSAQCAVPRDRRREQRRLRTLTLVSQKRPVKPATQKHVYEFNASTQEPPLRQGLEPHSLICVSQNAPE